MAIAQTGCGAGGGSWPGIRAAAGTHSSSVRRDLQGNSPKGLAVHKRWKNLKVKDIQHLCPLGTLFPCVLCLQGAEARLRGALRDPQVAVALAKTPAAASGEPALTSYMKGRGGGKVRLGS